MLPRVEALLAALLFAASTPLAKMLLGAVKPLPLAGLLYLGAGAVGGAYLAVRRARSSPARGRPLGTKEILALAGAVLAGGLIAPILMMYGLASTSAGTSSLLLNFEAVATAVIAGIVFREAIGRRVWTAIGLITAAAIMLAFRRGETWGISWGVFGILGACAFWGIDNNLTRLISDVNPMTIVSIKGWGAGSLALALALAAGEPLPSLRVALLALGLGAVSYGLSIALFVRALRQLGAARTGALFGTAPFLGALMAWAFLQESPTTSALLSVPMMLAGAWLLLTEAHAHRHHHPELYHDHSHTHDDGHHDHVHEGGGVPVGTRHSHPHRHEAMTHDHPHAPDLHHSHDHDRLP